MITFRPSKLVVTTLIMLIFSGSAYDLNQLSDFHAVLFSELGLLSRFDFQGQILHTNVLSCKGHLKVITRSSQGHSKKFFFSIETQTQLVMNKT